MKITKENTIPVLLIIILLSVYCKAIFLDFFSIS